MQPFQRVCENRCRNVRLIHEFRLPIANTQVVHVHYLPRDGSSGFAGDGN
jgi:hypothetical protein